MHRSGADVRGQIPRQSFVHLCRRDRVLFLAGQHAAAGDFDLDTNRISSENVIGGDYESDSDAEVFSRRHDHSNGAKQSFVG